MPETLSCSTVTGACRSEIEPKNTVHPRRCSAVMAGYARSTLPRSRASIALAYSTTAARTSAARMLRSTSGVAASVAWPAPTDPAALAAEAVSPAEGRCTAAAVVPADGASACGAIGAGVPGTGGLPDRVTRVAATTFG